MAIKARPILVRNTFLAPITISTASGTMMKYIMKSLWNVSPNRCAGSRLRPPIPPVTDSHSAKMKCRNTLAARVAMARYSPFTRSDGSPTRIPTAAAIRPASTNVTGNGSAVLIDSQATV